MNDNIHILVVDDSQENLRLVSHFLQGKNYKVALALDGKSALNILQTNKIDLLLLDIMMPDMDGFEVCSAIKANPGTKDIPVIFLTAKAETEDIVKGFQTGGVDYITKPFRSEELYARVNNQIQLKLMRDYLFENNQNLKGSQLELMRVLLDLAKTVKN